MAIIESKLKTGSLLLGGTEFACQATNVRIVPSFNEEGDAAETLCGDTLAPATTTDWALQGTHIQDWDSAGLGIVEYSWTNNLVTVPFVWKPNATAVQYTGNVQVRALELGGDVNTRITSDFDWPITTAPTPTWAAATAATGATAGTPGGWTPAGATPPATVADLTAGTPNTVTASPTTAWTIGQYVQTGTAGAGGQAYWNGTAWVAGTATFAEGEPTEDEEPPTDEEPDDGEPAAYER